MGIEKEELPKIFDPYFTTKSKGNGLGLATVHSIIHKHGGYIMAESESGFGATFRIYLPALKSGAPPAVEEKRGALLNGRGKLLIMEDEVIVRQVAGEMLEYLGYEVQFAEDGVQAIKAYKKAKESGEPFDAVLMDLTIPGGMGGKDAIRELREMDPEVKAIVSSGYSNDPIMANFEEYGFVGVVLKPYKIEELGKVLQKIIAR
jgi:CheY-like chemotaxis protein